MKFIGPATIVPRPHLDETKNDDIFLALSFIAKSDPEYLLFFKERAAEGKFVILDNSTIEGGTPDNFGDVLNIAIRMRASEIVLPDYFQDSRRTLEAASEGLAYVKANSGYHGKCMLAPKGTTAKEWATCAYAALKIDGVDTIGLSYRYTKMFGQRGLVAYGMEDELIKTGKSLHFLGCDIDPHIEITSNAQKNRIRSVDSSFAALYTKKGIRLSEETVRANPRTQGDHNLINFESEVLDTDLLRLNIKWWKDRCLGTNEKPVGFTSRYKSPRPQKDSRLEFHFSR